MTRHYTNPCIPYITLPSTQCKMVVLQPMTYSCSRAARDSNQNTSAEHATTVIVTISTNETHMTHSGTCTKAYIHQQLAIST